MELSYRTWNSAVYGFILAGYLSLTGIPPAVALLHGDRAPFFLYWLGAVGILDAVVVGWGFVKAVRRRRVIAGLTCRVAQESLTTGRAVDVSVRLLLKKPAVVRRLAVRFTVRAQDVRGGGTGGGHTISAAALVNPVREILAQDADLPAGQQVLRAQVPLPQEYPASGIWVHRTLGTIRPRHVKVWWTMEVSLDVVGAPRTSLESKVPVWPGRSVSLGRVGEGQVFQTHLVLEYARRAGFDERLLEACLLVARTGGGFDPRESRLLLWLAAGLFPDRDDHRELLGSLLDGHRPLPTILEGVSHGPVAQRFLAWVLCVATADGYVSMEESTLVEKTAQQLGLTSQDTETVRARVQNLLAADEAGRSRALLEDLLLAAGPVGRDPTKLYKVPLPN